jgi:hypothetical protein
MDVTSIIEAFDGYRALADSLGIGRTTVFTWQINGIPPARCLELADLAKSRGLRRITLKVLMQAKPRDRKPFQGRRPREKGPPMPLDAKRP